LRKKGQIGQHGFMSVLRALATNGGDDALPGAELWFARDWLPARQADALLAQLQESVDWETHRIRLFGREVESPRLSSWIGDEGVAYSYSGTRFQPHPWPAALADVRHRLESELHGGFNSVLANRYRSGSDYMGWHSDNEPALGRRPVIASLSLGATRRFVLKHRQEPTRKLSLDLPHGSLLVMRGDTQQCYRHSLPSTKKPVGERINLTFRRIMA
jgi:alkylated DNA repair dioxygenase AlkB